MRVLVAGVVEKAVVGHIGQAQVGALQGQRHTQQHTEERSGTADGGHHCCRTVSGSMPTGVHEEMWVPGVQVHIPEPLPRSHVVSAENVSEANNRLTSGILQ